jgi:hypothetical protein
MGLYRDQRSKIQQDCLYTNINCHICCLSHWYIFSTNQNWRPFFLLQYTSRIESRGLTYREYLPLQNILASPTLAGTGSENSVNNVSNRDSGKRVNPSCLWFSWVMLMGLCRLLMMHTTYDNRPWHRIGKTV